MKLKLSLISTILTCLVAVYAAEDSIPNTSNKTIPISSSKVIPTSSSKIITTTPSKVVLTTTTTTTGKMIPVNSSTSSKTIPTSLKVIQTSSSLASTESQVSTDSSVSSEATISTTTLTFKTSSPNRTVTHVVSGNFNDINSMALVCSNSDTLPYANNDISPEGRYCIEKYNKDYKRNVYDCMDIHESVDNIQDTSVGKCAIYTQKKNRKTTKATVCEHNYVLTKNPNYCSEGNQSNPSFTCEPNKPYTTAITKSCSDYIVVLNSDSSITYKTLPNIETSKTIPTSTIPSKTTSSSTKKTIPIPSNSYITLITEDSTTITATLPTTIKTISVGCGKKVLTSAYVNGSTIRGLNGCKTVSSSVVNCQQSYRTYGTCLVFTPRTYITATPPPGHTFVTLYYQNTMLVPVPENVAYTTDCGSDVVSTKQATLSYVEIPNYTFKNVTEEKFTYGIDDVRRISEYSESLLHPSTTISSPPKTIPTTYSKTIPQATKTLIETENPIYASLYVRATSGSKTIPTTSNEIKITSTKTISGKSIYATTSLSTKVPISRALHTLCKTRTSYYPNYSETCDPYLPTSLICDKTLYEGNLDCYTEYAATGSCIVYTSTRKITATKTVEDKYLGDDEMITTSIIDEDDVTTTTDEDEITITNKTIPKTKPPTLSENYCSEIVTVTVPASVTETITVTVTEPIENKCANRYEQCGGMYYNGLSCCEGLNCVKLNEYYSQCR